MIKPVADPRNSFAGLFAEAVAAQGMDVTRFEWDRLDSGIADFAILHWPYELLDPRGLRGIRHGLRCAARMRAARRKGVRIIWVAHNIVPHDSSPAAPWLTRRFVRSIDGIVHLSSFSHEAINARYRPPRGSAQIETVHGHYLDAMQTPVRSAPPVDEGVRLAYFGQIRPYKNVERLVALAARMPEEFTLSVSGLRTYTQVADEVAKAASRAPNVMLDLRSEPLPSDAIERRIDDAHAAVLPYSAILNSGAAMFALSRGRPVLAPNAGALPELRDAVGSNWLRLYDGELDVATLRDFASWIRTAHEPGRPDLSAFSWDRVGRDLGRLFDRLDGGTPAASETLTP